MKKIIFIGSLAISASILLVQCKKEKAPVDIVACTGTTPTYATDIKPIMDANCASSSCHSASKKKAGFDLSSYAGTNAAADNSAFLGSIQHKSGYTKMPDNQPQLSQDQLNKIACWVQNGRPQ
jgi:hypothetical protein